MPEITTYLGLEKALGGEKYSRAQNNRNLDRLEAEAKRQNDGVIRHAEFVRINQNNNAAGIPWGLGAMMALLEPATSKNYADWVSDAGADGLKLKEGVYNMTWKIVPTATVSLWHAMSPFVANIATMNANAYGRSVTVNVPANDPYFCYATDVIVPAEGMDMYFKYVCGTANTNTNHRIKITKVQ